MADSEIMRQIQKLLIFIGIGIIIGAIVIFAKARSVNAESVDYCIDNMTLNHTIDLFINGNETVIWIPKNCSNGCVNNACSGTNISGDMTSVWMIYGIGAVMLILAVVLGLPFGKTDSEINKSFNTTMVIKYMFFFIGLFLIYLSLGMLRRIGITYGGESNITNSVDTVTMIMIWTMILFLFMFMLELTISFLKMMKRRTEIRDKKKRGEEE